MSFPLFFFFLALAISSLVFACAWFLASRSFTDREKSSPFECGFDPRASSRSPFSMRFFLLAVVFLIFDIELALIMPLPVVMKLYPNISSLFVSTFFLLILLLGLLYEWYEGALSWAN